MKKLKDFFVKYKDIIAPGIILFWVLLLLVLSLLFNFKVKNDKDTQAVNYSNMSMVQPLSVINDTNVNDFNVAIPILYGSGQTSEYSIFQYDFIDGYNNLVTFYNHIINVVTDGGDTVVFFPNNNNYLVDTTGADYLVENISFLIVKPFQQKISYYNSNSIEITYMLENDINNFGELFIRFEQLTYDYENINLGWEMGYNDGYGQGFKDGENIGYINGKKAGYDIGYLKGYDDGIIANPNNNWSDLLFTIFGAFGTILAIEILPGWSIGVIVGIPIVFGIIYFIIGRKKD